VATNIDLDHSSPLGSNGPHCIEFLHEMRKLLLNLVPGEPLALGCSCAEHRGGSHPMCVDALNCT